MIRETEARLGGHGSGMVGGLGYPVATAIDRAAREPADRGGREREQDGTA